MELELPDADDVVVKLVPEAVNVPVSAPFAAREIEQVQTVDPVQVAVAPMIANCDCRSAHVRPEMHDAGIISVYDSVKLTLEVYVPADVKLRVPVSVALGLLMVSPAQVESGVSELMQALLIVQVPTRSPPHG